jgi:nicotinamidase-related amidase
MLRVRRIKTIVFTGVASHSGILTTARVATTLDYYAVIPRECVAGLNAPLHEAAMLILEPDVCGLEEVLAAWRSI